MNANPPSSSGSHVLTQLDVYDWGAFGGRHSAQIDLAGTAIIGPTGSGKTTLVDALMTLLVANPRYNLASTGGHESDRDLVSYVRGVSGAGNDDDGNEHIARPGATTTLISALFSDGESVVRIGGLFWFDGTSSAVADLKRRWLFCQCDDPGPDQWLQAHHEGGARALKELERSFPGVKVYETRQAYLARLRNHYEVGENAFALLNRAAGLKQLNSIDLVFRELVLDDRSAFASARAVVDEFDTLAGIRQELETARKQRDTLLPVEKGWGEYQDTTAALDEQHELQRVLPAWFGEQAVTLWQTRIAEQRQQLAERQMQSDSLAQHLQRAIADEQDRHATYLKVGGRQIEELHRQSDTLNKLREQCSLTAGNYQAWASSLGLDTRLDAATLQANQAQLEPLRAEKTKAWQQLQQKAWDAGSLQRACKERHAQLKEEYEQVRTRPGSNIPVPQQQFRSLLARHLGLDEDAVPFVAELVEVATEHAAWRGAIERALGSERLRLLLAPEHVPAALEWINARDNRLHVRLREASDNSQTVHFLDDGFSRKLNFKPHPHRQALKQLLAQIDRHCVDSVDALRETPHAMTLQGLMSNRAGYFDKQDHKPLDRDWMTGFDNRDQLARLTQEVTEAAQLLQEQQKQTHQAQADAEDIQRGLHLLERIGEVSFASIDVAGTEADLARLQVQIDEITNPASDASQARSNWEAARKHTEGLREQQLALHSETTVIRQAIDAATEATKRAQARTGNGLDDTQRDIVNRHLRAENIVANNDPHQLEDLERQARERIEQQLKRLGDRQRSIGQSLVREMGKAKVADTGALSETGTELQDVPAYLQRLQVLKEEALPEKQERFLAYLNQSSDQGVSQLLSEIDNEVIEIEERIAALNQTLQRVDFQPGRYLRLDPQRVEHESLRTLRQARAQLRSAQLKDDLGESHYRALATLTQLLRDAVDRRKTTAALALLDPRYRLQFAVLVVERDSGKVIERRTSSQGGSGGEKEIIASYVLTASLSYALCPSGRNRPLFGSIVLDEAFSKSSQAVAGRIIRALAEFGLHPLFVTPNKELRLLRDHTRSAIVVHRRGSQATMTSLSWEALEAHARSRTQRPQETDEVS